MLKIEELNGNWDTELGEYTPNYHNASHGERGRRTKEDCLDPTNLQFLCFSCHSKEHNITAKNSEWLN